MRAVAGTLESITRDGEGREASLVRDPTGRQWPARAQSTALLREAFARSLPCELSWHVVVGRSPW